MKTGQRSKVVKEQRNKVAKGQKHKVEKCQMTSVPLCLCAFFAFCFLTSPAGAETSSEQLEPNRLLVRQLWQARISVAKDEKDKKSKNELQRLIEQIRSVKFQPQNETSAPVISVEPVPATEPNETLSDKEAPEEERKKKEIESEPGTPSYNKLQSRNLLLYEPVSAQTLQMLENLAQHPDQLNNPFELGEVLFLSGHLKEADVFYQIALNLRSADEAGSAQDGAWILFQIGNCLRDDDPPTAMKMYRELITEYPDSPWTDLAKAQDKLIDWYQKDKPRMLITENQLDFSIANGVSQK